MSRNFAGHSKLSDEKGERMTVCPYNDMCNEYIYDVYEIYDIHSMHVMCTKHRYIMNFVSGLISSVCLLTCVCNK